MARSTCTFLECNRVVKGKGLCSGHWMQRHRGDELRPIRKEQSLICEFKDCCNPSIAKSLCRGHYTQLSRNRDLTKLNPKQGRPWKTSNGYILVYAPQHPNSRQSGVVFEHVIIMSQILGRALLPEENVHHKNGVRDNNRPENLELWTTKQPPGQRVEDKVEYAIEILKLYRPEILYNVPD